MDTQKFSNMKLDVYSDEAIGDRDYMEDLILFAMDDTNKIAKKVGDSNVTPYACFFVFDGHGGIQAASFAKKNLLNQLLQQEDFHSDDDAKVTKAIKEAFLKVQDMMQKDSCNWPKTEYGRKNTSGTTVSMVMIRKNKMYVAHVGDSRVVMGEQFGSAWDYEVLAEDHKPDDAKEMERIKRDGGEVIWRAGCPRVAWKRKRLLKSVAGEDVYDMVPFLAVARSLGDLWSYNPDKDVYTVSPEPDVTVHDFDPKKIKCVILASDGLWNVIHSGAAVRFVHAVHNNGEEKYVNIAKNLVNATLASCAVRKLKADNTSVVVICPSVEENDQEYPKDHFRVNFFEKPKVVNMLSLSPPQETKSILQDSIECLTSKPILINTDVEDQSIMSALQGENDVSKEEESLEDADMSICDVPCDDDTTSGTPVPDDTTSDTPVPDDTTSDTSVPNDTTSDTSVPDDTTSDTSVLHDIVSDTSIIGDEDTLLVDKDDISNLTSNDAATEDVSSDDIISADDDDDDTLSNDIISADDDDDDEKVEDRNSNSLVNDDDDDQEDETPADDISNDVESHKDDITSPHLSDSVVGGEDKSEEMSEVEMNLESFEECLDEMNESNSELNPLESSRLISSPFSKMNLARVNSPSLVRSLKRKSNSYHGTDSKKNKFAPQVSKSYSEGCKTRSPFENLQVCS